MLQKSYYLRLSVTNACNFSCAYCRPESASRCDVPRRLDSSQILSLLDPFGKVVPIHKIRFTGGEPLLRKDLPSLVQGVAKRFPKAELCVTTNGALLEKMAQPLYDAGITKVNVSLDTLEPDSFKAITRGGKLFSVLAGIEKAREVGFAQVKINSVLQKSINGDEIVELVKFAGARGCEIRFIELMPFGAGAELFSREFLSAQSALDRLKQSLLMVGSLGRTGTANRHLFHWKDKTIRVGFISSVSQPFCDSCNRIRLDSFGRMFSCIRLSQGVDLFTIQQQQGNQKVQNTLQNILGEKTPITNDWPDRTMGAIGG